MNTRGGFAYLAACVAVYAIMQITHSRYETARALRIQNSMDSFRLVYHCDKCASPNIPMDNNVAFWHYARTHLLDAPHSPLQHPHLPTSAKLSLSLSPTWKMASHTHPK
jgi:hypothetical protein